MIIQIRGTSGSGKTWVMRRVMEYLGAWKPVYVEGRKRPLYYIHERRSLLVLGSYESTCGGCDTIGSARAVYDLLKATQPTDHVLCEGLLLSEDVKWSSQLSGLRVIFLTTPLERCLEQIRSRRAESGNSKPLSEYNTVNRVATIERARLRLIEAGVDCRRYSASQAVREIVQWVS